MRESLFAKGEQMTAKEYLQKIRSERLEVEQLQDTIEELRCSLLPSGIRYDAVKVQTSPDDPMAKVFGKVDKLERKIREGLEEMVEKMNVAYDNINRLEKSEYRQVLTLYYLNKDRPTWSAVADRMEYSEQRIYQLHNDAISELEKEWKD